LSTKIFFADLGIAKHSEAYPVDAVSGAGWGVFALLRTSPTDGRRVLCLQNVTPQTQSAGAYMLEPYQTLWLDNPDENIVFLPSPGLSR
jgi:hypothetical protein